MDVLSEILASVRSASPLLAELRLRDRWGIDMEQGEGTPFHYIGEGGCWLQVDDRSLWLAEGDLVILPGWPRHAIVSEPGIELLTIRELVARHGFPQWTPNHGIDGPIRIGADGSCDVRLLSGIFGFDSHNASFLTDTLPPLLVVSADDIELSPWLDAMSSLVGSDRAMQPGFSAVAGRGMEFIFVHALRSWILQSPQSPGWLRGVLDARIGLALRAMHTDPRRAWTLTELADQAGQSRSNFAIRFRRLVGETPFGYLARWRLGQAAARLTRSGDAVARIAADMGYGSAFALSRAFRARFHVTPAEYRRRTRQGNHMPATSSIPPIVDTNA